MRKSSRWRLWFYLFAAGSSLARGSLLPNSMATIVYALSGEGRGHATRAQTVIDELRCEYDMLLYGYGQALDLLAPVYRDTNVTVRRIPGLHFHYSRRGTLDYARTLASSVPYLQQVKPRVEALACELERVSPALVITDFEPLLPRAAQRLGIPLISLDHQQFLTAYDLRCLPLRLRACARAMSPWVQLYYRDQLHSIVSSFYHAPLRAGLKSVTRVGVLLRSQILHADPRVGDHIVVYVRRHVPPSVLHALQSAGRPVRVYGLGRHPSVSRWLSFHEVDTHRFAEDLATSAALVCTAGNQLVGEALYMGKPVLALPEAGNFEQEINAHFLAASGMGEALPVGALDGARLQGFLGRLPGLRARIDRASICGNRETMQILRAHLPKPDISAGKRTWSKKAPPEPLLDERSCGGGPDWVTI